jgi:hypothetical protein
MLPAEDENNLEYFDTHLTNYELQADNGENEDDDEYGGEG